MKISVLGHPEFNLPETNKLLIPFSFPYKDEVKQEIYKHLSNDQPVFEVTWLDKIFKQILTPIPRDIEIINVLKEFTNLDNQDLGSICKSLNMTPKSLYRFVKKHFYLSPKQLKDVI